MIYLIVDLKKCRDCSFKFDICHSNFDGRSHAVIAARTESWITYHNHMYVNPIRILLAHARLLFFVRSQYVL
jgi:hypothetical protein